MTKSPSDAELVGRCGRGDRGAFRELFDRKYRRVVGLAYQILGDRVAAEDVAQEAFLALWRNSRRYRARFSLDTWLNRITTNKAIDRWRSERRHRVGRSDEDPDALGGRPPGAALGVDADPTLPVRQTAIQAVWDDLSQDLAPQQRAAFVLREIEGLPAREVARALGCSTSTVRSHIALARKHLRAAIRERYPELLGEAEASVS